MAPSRLCPVWHGDARVLSQQQVRSIHIHFLASTDSCLRIAELQTDSIEEMSDVARRGDVALCLIPSSPLTPMSLQKMVLWAKQANVAQETALPDLSIQHPPDCSAIFRVDGLLFSHSEAEYLPGPADCVAHWRLPETTTWTLSDKKRKCVTLKWKFGEMTPQTSGKSSDRKMSPCSDDVSVIIDPNALPKALVEDLKRNTEGTLIR